MGIDHHIDMERYLEAVELVRGKVDYKQNKLQQ
jgi:hypothetical protein